MNRKEFAMSAFHGAVYFPSRVYNAYQTYEYFDASELERDFSYAENLICRKSRNHRLEDFHKL